MCVFRDEDQLTGDGGRVPRIEIEVRPKKKEPDEIWWAVLILCLAVMTMMLAINGTEIKGMIEAGMQLLRPQIRPRLRRPRRRLLSGLKILIRDGIIRPER